MVIKKFIILLIVVFLGIIYAQKKGEEINIRCMILDSLSKEPIPCVQIKIENLNKSFVTKRSEVYFSLPKGEYDIILESPDYEVLKKHITVSLTSNTFVFELVKLSDRKKIQAHYYKFTACLDSFNYLLQNMDIPSAKRLLIVLQDFKNYGLPLNEKIFQNYDYYKKKWIDSLMALAYMNEDSARYAEAFYYYRRIADFDSTQFEALSRMRLMDSLLLVKNKPQTASKPEKLVKKSKTPEEIDALYKTGVSKFVNGEFKEALKIFKEVLSYAPNHEKAQEYLRRTEARIKILEGK